MKNKWIGKQHCLKSPLDENNDIYIYAFSSASIQLSVQVNVGVFSILISTGFIQKIKQCCAYPTAQPLSLSVQVLLQSPLRCLQIRLSTVILWTHSYNTQAT